MLNVGAGLLPASASLSQRGQVQVTPAHLESGLDGHEGVEGLTELTLGLCMVANTLGQPAQDALRKADSIQAVALGGQLLTFGGDVPRPLDLAGQADG